MSERCSVAKANGRSVLLIVENCSVPFDRRVWEEARALRDAGYRVSIIAPREAGQASRELLEGIDIHRHPALPEGDGLFGYACEYAAALFWETVLAWRIFLRTRFDVVHVSNPPDTLFLVAGPFKLLFGRRLVFDHHDICPELYQAKFGRRGLAYRLLCRLEKWSIRTADLVISTNDSYRRIALGRGGKEPLRVAVVRNGPNLDRVRQAPPVPSLKNGRACLVGYVGVIGVQEGLRYLIQAACHIVHEWQRNDIQFAIIGGGSDLPNVRALAQRLNVSDHFTFTGRVPDQTLMEFLNTSDICVNPDEYNEMNDCSTMTKIMEYMALGKPIVQFAMTEGRVSAGDASLYAAPNDAVDFARKIIELADDPAKREAMGRYGRLRVERELAWTHQAPKLLTAYATLWPTPEPVANIREPMRGAP
jgi:glycosyltransferase involved in cell wall biosynthesis